MGGVWLDVIVVIIVAIVIFNDALGAALYGRITGIFLGGSGRAAMSVGTVLIFFAEGIVLRLAGQTFPVVIGCAIGFAGSSRVVHRLGLRAQIFPPLPFDDNFGGEGCFQFAVGTGDGRAARSRRGIRR